MQSARRFFLNIATLAASGLLTLLLLEIVLRFLPVAWAPPVQPPTPDNPIQRYVANTPFTWSLGWNFYHVVHGHSNAQGFLADQNYDSAATTPLVAVVGDSYVEALQVPFAESLTGRLQRMLGTRGRAYAIAQSGSPLSQYVAYAAHACKVYRPQRLVVVVVGNDFDESIYAHRQRDGIHHLYRHTDGGFDYKLTPPSQPGLVERFAHHSALALYLARNVGAGQVLARMGISPAHAEALNAYVGNTSADASPERIAEGEKVIAWFLDALPQAACLAPSNIVLAVDAIRPQIYNDEQLIAARSSYFGVLRAKLMSDATSKGFVVVDMELPMRADYASFHREFEFPTDGHWNAHAHSVAAAAVSKALGDWSPLAAETSHAPSQ